MKYARKNKTVYIVIKDGMVDEVWADCDVDVVVCDRDCTIGDIKDEIDRFVAELPTIAHEVDIF